MRELGIKFQRERSNARAQKKNEKKKKKKTGKSVVRNEISCNEKLSRNKAFAKQYVEGLNISSEAEMKRNMKRLGDGRVRRKREQRGGKNCKIDGKHICRRIVS